MLAREKTIEHINSYHTAEWVIIDGQSRGYLSIHKFLTNKIPCGDFINFKGYNKENHMVEEYQAKGKFFKDMPEWVKDYINNLEEFFSKNPPSHTLTAPLA